MPTNGSTRSSIASLLESFAEQIESLVRQQALDRVTSALGGDGASSATSGRRGRPKGKKTTRGGKRSSTGVDEIGERLLAHIENNPGQRADQIATAMRTEATTIRLPMKKLIAAKKVKSKGQRRGMTYAAV
jgi:hypothetical protein